MRVVGIRELKAQLSQVLREVQRGEVVLVTDRGQVVAELRRPDRSIQPASGPERVLTRLAADGTLRLRETVAEPYPASPLSLPDGSALELLSEDRGEQ
jgi:antitoxin (DNA-binding transcriptional repressor) of toxin-antitoxin stability system